MGFGDGVSLGFSTYDTGSGRLSLSTGEQYQVDESVYGITLNIRQKKLDSFRMEKQDGEAYKIIHSSGDLEFLQGFDYGTHLKLPTRLVSATGHTLYVDSDNINGKIYISGLRDESDIVLLNIDYEGNNTTLTFYPETPESYCVVLTTDNGYLTTITHEAPGDESLIWAIGYDDTTMGRLATSLTSPGGMTEIVTYPPRNSDVGHKFPETSPLSGQLMPYVTTYKKMPGVGQAEIVSDYKYSLSNYLGFQSELNSWGDNDDNLYSITSQYSYSSTETRHNNAGENQLITRTYDKFHLETNELTQCGSFQSEKSTLYYAQEEGVEFDDQPAQFQCPTGTITTWTDKSDGTNILSRKEEVTTEFSDKGLQTKQTDADGTVTTWEYYPAEGGTDCPKEPNGFTRFMKSETVTSRDKKSKHETVYTYATAEHVGTAVSTLVMKNTETHFADGQHLKTLTCKYGTGTEKTAGVLTEKTTAYPVDGASDYITTEKVTFSNTTVRVDDKNVIEALRANYSLTSHDGLTLTHSKTVSRVTKRLLEKTDSKGMVTAYTHNSLGWLTKRVHCKGDSQYENTTTWDYTVDDTCGVSVTTTDASGNKVRHALDGMGRLLHIKKNDVDMDSSNAEPEFLMQQQTWDALGRSRQGTSHDYKQAADKNKATQTVTQTQSYDNWGQVNQSVSSAGVTTHTETVLVPAPAADNCVWQTRSWQSGGAETSGITVTTLDDNHNPVKTELYPKNAQPGKSTPYSTTTSAYDGWNRLRRQTDELGQTTTYEYDAWGRPTVTTLPDGTRTVREYVAFSSAKLLTAISVHDSKGNPVPGVGGEQGFDGLGRLKSTTSGGRAERYSYDQPYQRHPSRVMTATAGYVIYAYNDALGEVPESLSTVGAGINVNQSWTYNPVTAAMLTATEDQHTLSYGYAASGQRTAVTVEKEGGIEKKNTTLEGRTIGGTATTITDYAGKIQTLTLDPFGRATALDDEDVSCTLTYDGLGQVTQWTATSNTTHYTKTTTLTLDDYGRETCRVTETLDGSKTLKDTLTITQAWSQKHQVTQRTTKQMTAGKSVILRDETYDFDPKRGWLRYYGVTGSTPPRDESGRPLSQQVFTYDAVTGNMVSKTTMFTDGNISTTNYKYENEEDRCQLSRIVTDGTSVTLEYDGAGRLTRDEYGRTLSYDALGRLCEVKKGDSTLSSYRYDASNQLAGQTTGDTTTHHYYANNTLSYLEDNQKNSTRLTPYAQVSKGKNAGTWLTSTDMMGSVLSVTDGNTTESHAFTPYGERGSDNDSPDNSVVVTGYNGERLDDMVRQYHLGNGYRAYNPALQRFTCPDSMSPFGDGGINQYIYCEGDPINLTDPTGHGHLLRRRVEKGVATVVDIIGRSTKDAVEEEIGKEVFTAYRAAPDEVTEEVFDPNTVNQHDKQNWDLNAPEDRAKDYYAAKRSFQPLAVNDNGGRVWATRYRSVGKQIKPLVEEAVRKREPVTILSGTHGARDGNRTLTRKFIDLELYREDRKLYKRAGRTEVIDITRISNEELTQIVRKRRGHIFASFCYSYNDNELRDILGLMRGGVSIVRR
ncbi:hypothetical protein LG003_21185 [Photorhabdus kleinii]|uniref:RHS repeat-associated core domain-containing protein n=1 Tax=Photorhabdus kleinii TaxID=768034 RepID=UPI0021D4CE6C|nr:RHS repeat-associated core domain-containing protein [Photorhabdus kleinii]MCT8345287.1 hypothetical protein [Photorhabdus kleinii]